MLTVVEALAHVLEQALPLAPQELSTMQAVGLALAENISSDIDSPPFDKSLVDGYAVRSVDLAAGRGTLEILEEVTAGGVPRLPLAAGKTTRIMTGAPLPQGCDAVVMFERTQTPAGTAPGAMVTFEDPGLRSEQNLLRQATVMRDGQQVLAAGHVIRAAEVGLLSEVGRTCVRCTPRPTVAILPTGNEIVPPSQRPQGGQIRNSNGPMLAAAAQEAGAVPQEFQPAEDQRAMLAQLITAGLAADVLLLSGGVSVGVLDLVPAVLQELGVRRVFHGVRFKPGKPLWFGIAERAGRRALVFGLPGNPVSSLVCFQMFVRPAIARLAGRHGGEMASVQGALTGPFTHRGDRPTYHPASLRRNTSGHVEVEPLPWQGSADLCGMVRANGLAHFPAGEHRYATGDVVEAFWF